MEILPSFFILGREIAQQLSLPVGEEEERKALEKKGLFWLLLCTVEMSFSLFFFLLGKSNSLQFSRLPPSSNVTFALFLSLLPLFALYPTAPLLLYLSLLFLLPYLDGKNIKRGSNTNKKTYTKICLWLCEAALFFVY